METNEYQRNEKKIALFFIAIGLILGGIIGITQQPPPKPSAGWTAFSQNLNVGKSIIISDQNNDSINDIFVWTNPENNSSTSQNMAFILSGRTGEILRQATYSDPKSVIFLDSHGKNNIFYTDSGYILLIGLLFVPKPNSEYFDCIQSRSGPLLLQIKTSTLELNKVVNITKEGWEPIEAFEDKITFNDDYFRNLGWISHLCKFLVNMSVSAPQSTYNGELLTFSNVFPYLNDTLDGYNYTKKKYTFVRPDTLEKVSEVELYINSLGFQGIFIEGFCEKPLTELESSKFLPYLYIFREHSELPAGKNKTITILKISELKNYSLPTTYLVENLSVFELNFRFSHEIYQEMDVYLNYNSSNGPAGLSILLKYPQLKNNTVPAELRSQIKSPWFIDQEFIIVVGSLMECFNLERISQGDFNKTFSYYSKFQNELPFLGDISMGPAGVIQKVVPIKLDIRSSESSIALLSYSSGLNYQTIGDFLYASMEIKIIYLDSNKNGLNSATVNQTLGSVEEMQIVMRINGDIHDSYILNPVDFDFDGDNRTDIILPGTLIDDYLASKSNYITGPFTAVSIPNRVKTTSFSTDYGKAIWGVSDVNGDNKSDVFFFGRYMMFLIDEQEDKSWWESKVSDPINLNFMIIGFIMVVLGILIFIFIILKYRNIKSKRLLFSKGMLIQMIISAALIGFLYMQFFDLLRATSHQGFLLIGDTPESTAITNLSRISGYATFAFFTALPVSIGVYILLAPSSADAIVGFNQVFYGKQAGLKAVIKKEAISEDDLQKSWHIDYRLMIVPPFGRPRHIFLTISRVFSVLALTVSIGLNFFTYGAGFLVDLSQITVFTGLGDKNFVLYISAIFLYLIIPGIAAVPLFFWLIPSTWLLDDVGVLFYAKRTNNRTPEDVESVAGWFSNYLKGFLGLGAIFSYIQFVQKSPIIVSLPNLNPYGNTVSTFVFGYIIIAGLAFGLITVMFHEIALPYTAISLIKRLEARKVPIERTKIEFVKSEPLSEQDFLDGYKASKSERSEPKTE